jgi:hypothetical protein
LPELEFRDSLFLSLRILKHRLGEKTAKTPKMQIKLKIEPMSGFRQGTFPDTFGGEPVRIAMRSNPKNERKDRKIMSKPRCCLEVMFNRCSEK